MTERMPAAKRKSRAELAAIRALIEEAVPSEDWLPILRQLAKSDNPKVIELLLKYRFGLPGTPADLRANADELVHIWLPPIDGTEQLEVTQGTADAVSRKQGGRAAVRRSGGRGQK